MNAQHTQIYERDTMKAALRGQLIALSASKKKPETAYTSTLIAHLKALEQREANTPKRSRRQETIKLRAEIKLKQINSTKNQQNQELVIWENQQDK